MKISQYAFCLLFINGYVQGANNYEITDRDEIAPSYTHDDVHDTPSLSEEDITRISIGRNIIAAQNGINLLFNSAINSDDPEKLGNILYELRSYAAVYINNPILSTEITKIIKIIDGKLELLMDQEEQSDNERELANSDDLPYADAEHNN